VLTEKDASDLTSIQKRISKVIPNDAAKNSVIAGLIADAKLMVDAARKQIDAELEKARENGTIRWYRKSHPI
jgi:20S proteasome alpha/beta subunit